MSYLEETMLRRWSGLRITAVSAALAVVGVAPLLLYIAFGPKNGNPIGLGLLAVATLPFAAMGLLVGVIKLLVEHFRPGSE
jgi:hypothetical protein